MQRPIDFTAAKLGLLPPLWMRYALTWERFEGIGELIEALSRAGRAAVK